MFQVITTTEQNAPTKRPGKQNLANCHVFYKLGENCCSTGALKQTKSSTRSQAPNQGIKHVYKLISQQKPVAYRFEVTRFDIKIFESNFCMFTNILL